MLGVLAARFDIVGAGGCFQPFNRLAQAALQGEKLGAGVVASRM